MRARAFVLVLTAVGCRTEPSPTTHATPTSAPTEALGDHRTEPKPKPQPDPLTLCDGSWWALTLPPPGEDGLRAHLRVKKNPGHSYRRGEPEPLCVRWGDGPWELAEPGMLEVAADPKRLQRWLIGQFPILIHVPPGDEIAYRFHACMNWQFGGVRFDPQLSKDPDKLAVIQIVDAQTRQTRARPVYVGDLPEQLAVEIGDTHALPVERIAPGTALWHSTEHSERLRAVTSTDSVGLILGIGEHWRIWIEDDGRLTGEFVSGP